MKPAPFTYHRPQTVADAIALLATYADQDGRVLAGGQSLVPIMAFRLARPAHLIDINRIPELGTLQLQGQVLHVGALVRHAMLGADAAPGPLGRLLGLVMRHIAHAPIRARGTFCGSLAHADPASEWCCLAVALEATLLAQGPGGLRRLPAREFFAGVMTTILHPDELLVAAELPLLPPDSQVGFSEFSRRQGDFALGMAVAVLRLAAGKVVECRIAVGGSEATPRRLAAAESALIGTSADDAAIAAAASAAAAALDPLEDDQNDAAYRRDVAHAVVTRALTQARDDR